jgi:hypothetical protein
MLALHELLSLALLYTCFCRAVKTNKTVRKDVLAAFWFLGATASMSMFAPLAFGWRPDFVSLTLLASILAVQVATSARWRTGIPKDFINESQR